MNPEAQKLFDDILAKDISSVTEADALFLQARRQYLSRDQKKKYAHLLKLEAEPKEEAPQNVPPSEHPADQPVKKQEDDDDDDE